jgi:hypothetical protein
MAIKIKVITGAIDHATSLKNNIGVYLNDS